MKERHDILWNTIGFLEEEQIALENGYLILVLSSAWIFIGGFAEAYFFSLYNGKFHPFANILQNHQENEGNYS